MTKKYYIIKLIAISLSLFLSEMSCFCKLDIPIRNLHR